MENKYPFTVIYYDYNNMLTTRSFQYWFQAQEFADGIRMGRFVKITINEENNAIEINR